MGLFKKRKSRATRRAEARALKAKAKLEARLAAKGEARRFKLTQRAHKQAHRAELRAQHKRDRAALKAAKLQLKHAQSGKWLSPGRIHRFLEVTRLIIPILAPLAYRGATSIRGFLDQYQADKWGIPLIELGKFSTRSGKLLSRLSKIDNLLNHLDDHQDDEETKQFIIITRQQLATLNAAIRMAQTMSTSTRDRTYYALENQIQDIEAAVCLKLGIA